MPDQVDSLSIVVPVYDEAENILPLIAEIQAVMKTAALDYEIVYVDDGSRDQTRRKLDQAKEHSPGLRILRLKENCGQSTAIRLGVEAATKTFIVTLDGDGQNDPADIPRLIEAYSVTPGTPGTPATGRGFPPLVAGVRRRRKDSALRRFSSRIANSVRRALLRDGTPDTGCGLKLFTRESFLALPFFDHMHRFHPALHRRAGGGIILVDVRHRPRQRGKSKYGVSNRLWVGLADLAGVMWLNRRAPKPVIEDKE